MTASFRNLRFLLLIFVTIFLAVGGEARAQEKIWRVIYVEGGPFSNYQQTLA